MNNDGLDDFIAVHREENRIELFLSNRADSSYRSISLSVQYYTDRALIGDISNDKIADILCYGKLSTGITVFPGRGNGVFSPARKLFDDVPVSDVSLLALNGDNITDISLHNWLTNQTIVYLGLGKMKFAEQSVLSFAQDTVKTYFGDFNSDQLADVAVYSTQQRTIQILDGDGLGNFSFAQSIAMRSSLQAIEGGTFRTGTSTDLFVHGAPSDGVSIVINKGEGFFYDEIPFGTVPAASHVQRGDLNGDGLDDVLVMTGDSTYAIYWNSRTAETAPAKIVRYAVGAQPLQIYVNDLNNDGNDDLVISNSGSATVSVLISAPNGLSGPVTVETAEQPANVALYGRTDTSQTFYTVHPESQRISLITFRPDPADGKFAPDEVEQFSIPLPGKPMTVLPDVSFMEKGISLYVFMTGERNTMIFYRQVKGTKFATKSLLPLIPSHMIMATINDLNFDGKADLIYLYGDERQRRNILGITMNDSTGEFKGNVFSVLLPDSVVRRASVFIEDVNGDHIKDIVLCTVPGNTLRWSRGRADGSFERFEMIVEAGIIHSAEQIQLYDMDNDGITDIVFLTQSDRQLVWRKGRGNGRFAPEKTITALPENASFRCGDFNGDNAVDVAWTEQSHSTLVIHYGVLE